MRRKEAHVIDGARYEIRQMASMDALYVQAQLIRLLGEPLARMIMEVDSLSDMLALDLDGEGRATLAAGIKVLADRLDPAAVVDMARRLVVGNLVGEYDKHMLEIEDLDTYEHVMGQHDPWHQLKVLKACLVVQFRPRGAGASTDPAEAPAEGAG